MKDQPWIDILPPPAPVESFPWWAWFCVVIIITIIPAFIYLWRHTAKQQALMKLKTVKHKLNEDHELDMIPFEISQVLKTRFNVTNIDKINIAQHPEWLDYKQQLTGYCFSKHRIERDQLEILLANTQYWLRYKDHEHG